MRITSSLLRTGTGQVIPWRQIRLAFSLLAAAGAVAAESSAQPPNNLQRNAFQAPLAAPANGPQNGAAPAGPNTNNPLGGGQNADFDSLIDLIVSTVATETWAENGGGEAEVRPFPGGVLVDAAGTLRLKSRKLAVTGDDLLVQRGAAPPRAMKGIGNARRRSSLRYVSLPRLEREIARRQSAHEPLDPAMLTLAGLQRVRYVFVYPESGDLVLAGPAGDWQADADGRLLSTETGEAVVRLDDLLVLLRRGQNAATNHFGCSINPRPDALAKTQALLASTSERPLQPGERKKWLGNLRDAVGLQDIEVFGVDPASRVASVLVEADYHMKLIGMGLAEGVAGMESYLASIRLGPGESPPPMSVLRWWFTLNYQAVRSTAMADAFELVGQGVRVLSENELLAEQGKRIHTGQSEPLNSQFAERFTAHFGELAAKYPVYSELRNVFDLAMAVALIEENDLAGRVGWQPGLLASGQELRLPKSPVPRQVETVVNHRLINRRQIVAGVSGGVMVDPADVLKATRVAARTSDMASMRRSAPNGETGDAGWWWDGASD